MTVKTHHKDYDYYSPEWAKCRDCYMGQKAIKSKNATYLPLLGSSDSPEDELYKGYKQRALFFNGTRRTMQAMEGLLFRADPAVDDRYTDQIDTEDLLDLSRYIVQEVIKTGRVGILIDAAPEAGSEPVFVKYTAESIINWSSNFVVLKEEILVEGEPGKQDGGISFELKSEDQYRVLTYDENGNYIQKLYDKEGQFVEDIEITVADQKLDVIPFYIINTTTIGNAVEQPPLIDLVDVNIAHYMNSADYEHGRHYTALPTAVLTGATPEDIKGNQNQHGKIEIGSSSVITLENPAASASYLEFTGVGLSHARDGLLDKKADMGALGARMLMPEKLAAETAESQNIKRQGELSHLASIANNVSEAVSLIAIMYLRWKSVSATEFTFELNKDFNPAGLSAQDLTALLSTWQSGAISMQELFIKLKEGEIIDQAKTFEEHQDEIADDIVLNGNGSDSSNDSDSSLIA